VELDSYTDAGVLTAVVLVNELTPGHARGKPLPALVDPLGALGRALAADPQSVAQVRARDAPGFIALAHRLRDVFADLDEGDVDAAAHGLNELLAAHPANAHLANEEGRWRLHHHPIDAPLVAMWTSICAEGLARMIGADRSDRLGICDANHCDRVFVDTSKNASRRYCSTACQNRIKTAAFRRRHTTPAHRTA
jgi:predicted RNA-binding Zn ribbon-like protein